VSRYSNGWFAVGLAVVAVVVSQLTKFLLIGNYFAMNSGWSEWTPFADRGHVAGLGSNTWTHPDADLHLCVPCGQRLREHRCLGFDDYRRAVDTLPQRVTLVGCSPVFLSWTNLLRGLYAVTIAWICIDEPSQPNISIVVCIYRHIRLCVCVSRGVVDARNRGSVS